MVGEKLLTPLKKLFGNRSGQKQFKAGTGEIRPIQMDRFDGEKSYGELGPPKNVYPDRERLAVRSKQSYLENDVCRTIINGFCNWIIGKGLSLEPEPYQQILERRYQVDFDQFRQDVSDHFMLWSNSSYADYSLEKNLHELGYEALQNSLLTGDTLVICRFINGRLNLQLVDGALLRTPLEENRFNQSSNKIDHGIEVNRRGQHVAYHVLENDGINVKRIPAYSRSSKLRMAWLVPGVKHEINDNRGVSILASTLETLGKLDRYREATVSSAEEAAKIVYQIVHDNNSTGENPVLSTFAKAVDDNADTLPTTDDGETLAQNVAASTNRQTFNNPIGSKLESLDHSNREQNFEGFHNANIRLICSAIGIPPEVAMKMFNSNFSASRAALKDWEHTMDIWRSHLARNFYQPVYDLWLTSQVLTDRIQADGFAEAYVDRDIEVLQSFRNARWIGKGVPHIDPVKEVNAARLQLGEYGKGLPLSTVRKVTEELNNGDSEVNLERFSKEKKNAEDADIEPAGPSNSNNQSGDETDTD